MTNIKMVSNTDDRTPVTLLEVLRRGEDTVNAWKIFVERYGRILFRWCQSWGLQTADAQDVAQNTLLAIVKQIEGFHYDRSGSFRSFLKTIAHRCYLRAVNERHRLMSEHADVDDAISSLEARENLERAFDEMARREIFELAAERVKARVETHTWLAFELTALQGKSGDDVAKQLGINLGSVYMARSRVQLLLREEWLKLDPELRREEAND